MSRNNEEVKATIIALERQALEQWNNGNPDELVKYGKYEMRIRDKILIDNGYITKAKVKWYGGGSYAYPYLWKTNKSDLEYQESWDDPRLLKVPKTEQKLKSPTIQKKNRGKKI